MHPPFDNVIISDVIDEDEFDDLSLYRRHPVPWVPAFNAHVVTHPPILPGGAPPAHIPFSGGERLYTHSDIIGSLHAIPPQQGIPGWQRIVFARFSGVGSAVYRLHNDADLARGLKDLRFYEGVVLPGGKIMLGRWWDPLHPDPEKPSGPFIYWAVEYEDDSESDDDDDDDDDNDDGSDDDDGSNGE